MGVFSWTCAKTNLPILNTMVAAARDQAEVVVLGKDGSVLRGEYDGYGRVLSELGAVDVMDAIFDDEARVVLAVFYDPTTDTFDSLVANQSDPGQGHFHDQVFIKDAFGRGGYASHADYLKAFWSHG